ncbi:MAG: dienelactone hydrolase [Vicinamibacterales bacterium]
MRFRLTAVLVACLTVASVAGAQTNRIDMIAPFAPELARHGGYTIGVRTFDVTDRNRIDVLNTTEGAPNARYDRRLVLEAWYPATLEPGQQPGGATRVITRDPSVTAVLYGRAVRGAAPVAADGPFPLVIVSHGYPGNRFLMSHLCENLATKGFVVVAIDHPDSTYDDQQAFGSTLFNRAFDQLFVLNEIARLGGTGSGHFLAGIVDATRTGIVGYSMGGYGLVNVVGGGYADAAAMANNAPPNRLLAQRTASNPDYQKTMDPRIKAAIAVAPWGMQNGFWDATGLQGIRTPVLFVAGSNDNVAQYERGTKAIYEGAVHAERWLLTFINANHNAGAPIPAPIETYRYSETLKSYPFVHYADAVWDSVRMNNILDHFATAFFELHLKGQQDRRAYFAREANGDFKGFLPRTSVGLTLDYQAGR